MEDYEMKDKLLGALIRKKNRLLPDNALASHLSFDLDKTRVLLRQIEADGYIKRHPRQPI